MLQSDIVHRRSPHFISITMCQLYCCVTKSWKKSWIHWLKCNPTSVTIQVCKPLFPNHIIQVMLCLMLIIWLSNVWYNIYHLLPPHTKVQCVSLKNKLTCFTCFSNTNVQLLRGKELSIVVILLPIFLKQLTTVIQGTGSSPNSKSPSSHTLCNLGFYVTPVISSALASSPPSYINYHFALLLVYIHLGPRSTWY